LNVSQRMRYLDLSMQSHYYLWKISEYTHQREDELYHSNQYLVLKDSVNDIHLSDRIAQFQFQTQIERKQHENELLQETQLRNEIIIHQQDQQRAILALLALLVSIMLYFQWRNARRTKQRNRILQEHLKTLVEFSKSKVVNFGSVADATREIARLTAHSLGVSRISIWNYDEDARTITSNACYDLASGQFLENTTLDLKAVPNYENAIKTKRIIEANDARTDVETREFKDSYLVPLNIHSMLDVTFSRDGQLDGLICCEQQGSPRKWKSEDIIFVSSVADIISLAYRTVQRREYERRLKTQAKEIIRMNEGLEQRVKERTEELQSRNHQLTEYAFINSHLLRSPVSKILGLIGLMEVDKTSDPQVMIDHLRTSCNELDNIVTKITSTLDGGENLDRNTFKK
jgi:C4-dicarboxylate-specific signal transduction histidine kinase